MYWFVVWTVIAIIGVTWYLVKSRYRKYPSTWFGAIATGLCVAFFGSLLTVLAVSEYVHRDTPLEHSFDIQLAGLNDTSSVEGQFFLFSGSIDQKLRYVYYKYVGGGAYELDWKLAKWCKVIEEDRDDAIMEVWDEPEGDLGNWSYVPDMKQEYVFRVPNGSITRDTTLDLEVN